MKKIIAATLALMSVTTCSAALLPVEKKMLDYVQSEQDHQQKFLKRLTNINSGTLNTQGVRETGEIVREDLKQLGFKSSWVNEPVAMHRAGTLIAVHSGKQDKYLLLIGHLDTVFSKSAPFKDYIQKKYSAKGQGVIDDKGGIAVMLFALKALQAAGMLHDSSIIVVLTGDEEDSGKPTAISRQPLMQAAKKSMAALDFEPSITANSATIARRGISTWTITTHGNASHSATIFQADVGIGAIFGLAHQLEEMRNQLYEVKYLSFNPGIILGGSSLRFDSATATGSAEGRENIVASTAMAKGDFRYIDVTQKNWAENKMRAIIVAKLSGVTSQIKFVDGIPPMPPTENNLKLLNEYSQVSIDLGQGKVVPLDAGIRGAGDISYVAGIVPASLSGLGPIGLGSHTVIETIELPSLVTQTQRVAILISRLIRRS